MPIDSKFALPGDVVRRADGVAHVTELPETLMGFGIARCGKELAVHSGTAPGTKVAEDLLGKRATDDVVTCLRCLSNE